jgi:hypothetical protein
MEAELLGMLISAPKRGEWSVRALSASSSVDKTLRGFLVSLDFVLDRNNIIKMQRYNGMNISGYGKKSAAHAGIPLRKINVVFS